MVQKLIMFAAQLLGRSEYVFSQFGTINRTSFFLSNFKNTIKTRNLKKIWNKI